MATYRVIDDQMIRIRGIESNSVVFRIPGGCKGSILKYDGL